MGKKLIILVFCFTLIAGFLPQGNSMAASGTITISSAVVNIREGPGLSYPLVKQAIKGEKYSIIREQGDWIEVKLSAGQTGWVANWVASSANSDTSVTSNKTSIGVVTVPSLNIRTSPSSASSAVGKLSKGMTVTVYGTQNNWTQIQFNGQAAWVSSQFLDIQTNTQKGNDTTSSTSGTIGMVTAGSLSVRSGASLNATIIGSVHKGQSFSLLGEKNDWIKIEYEPNRYGWVAGWYIDVTTANVNSEPVANVSKVTIVNNGTNIRKGPNVQSDVFLRANEGDTFTVIEEENDWYAVRLANGSIGYVAGWLVSINGTSPSIKRKGAGTDLRNKTIVLDPGHGGIDTGTTGASGTLEKNLTIRTARLLYDKLRASGANVILTRNSDTYISLPERVSIARAYQADAFVSIHYDANSNRSVRGMTGYYYHTYQKSLAEYLYSSTINQTKLNYRGVRFGDYHVIRENSQNGALMELGYLSNPEEEMTLNSNQYQENAATGLYNGLTHYFKDN
ncbi:SH3 domain-containing protein [Neobacillus cucumis]|nr:SH3 domain-containing protein [Neobacillus cucumis]